MTNDDIKEIALANGFKLKEQPSGEMDLNPYVYDFARSLLSVKLNEVAEDMMRLIDVNDTLESQMMLDGCDDIIDRHIDALKK